MSFIEFFPHLLLRIQLSISQKKQMRADADRIKVHEKELDRMEVCIMLCTLAVAAVNAFVLG